jgi:membrane protein implicated in regulation of membrane protease activity
MRWRTYGEQEPEESPVGCFFLGFFIGAICIYDGGAWILVSWGVVSQGVMRSICAGIGMLIGAKMAYNSQCRKKEKQDGDRLR